MRVVSFINQILWRLITLFNFPLEFLVSLKQLDPTWQHSGETLFHGTTLWAAQQISTLPLFFTKNVAGKALEILSGTLNLINTIGEVRDGDRGVQAKRREAT